MVTLVTRKANEDIMVLMVEFGRCNELAGFYFKMEVYYTPKFNTQLLITVHNSSRILTLI
jgi:hypothetical protein